MDMAIAAHQILDFLMLEALLHYCLFNVMYDTDVWEWKRNTRQHKYKHASNLINQEYLKHITSANKGSWQAERLSPDSNKSQALLQLSPVLCMIIYIYIIHRFLRRLCQPKWIQNFDSKGVSTWLRGRHFCCCTPPPESRERSRSWSPQNHSHPGGAAQVSCAKKAWSHIL